MNTQNASAQQQQQQLGSFQTNRNLKYLTTELAKYGSTENKVLVLASYLSGCKYNCTYRPDGVIKFNDVDVRELVEWGIRKSNNESQDADSQVKILIGQRCVLQRFSQKLWTPQIYIKTSKVAKTLLDSFADILFELYLECIE